MENVRYKALELIQKRKPTDPVATQEKNSTIFGSHVFSSEVMRGYLPKDVYKQLMGAIDQGGTLNRDIADKVANAMKTWALERGVTHYTHWFQPLTGLTAEKHDAFFSIEDGEALEIFSGDNLAQQEPDASSLPSGGLRNTFEARGYTAWDPSSPAFIFENRFGKTLCIPTIFVSYTGEALDFKAPLLKSITLLEKAATEVCHYFDRNVTKVWPTLGIEQEYFLVDSALFDLRPDLMLTGRTLVGSAAARGQQLEDHYFGTIPERVFGFMKEFETESYKLGIPLKTRHNEVAPNQFECAPIFEELNLAIDHNQLLMDVMERVARKHSFRVLLHEKPFAGINGSGKHNNWSMSTDTGKNLLSPGKNPKDNLQFLAFFVNTIKAVYDHADLLRASIASASNDHRLGANEAPPAIVSVFVGTAMERILAEVEKPSKKAVKDAPKAFIKLGINKIPEILMDNTDRNRTSPFAFTGNKFEFRAVGSSANSAGAMTVLNCIVANQLAEFKATVDRKVSRGKNLQASILEVLSEYITHSKSVLFHGNGYSDEWKAEAKRRGLSNIPDTPRALDAYMSQSSLELFKSLGVFGEKEVEARHEIMLEMYCKKVDIEARALNELSRTMVIPAAIRYQSELAAAIGNLKAAGVKAPTEQIKMLEQVNAGIVAVMKGVDGLQALLHNQKSHKNMRDTAINFRDKVIPVIAEIRAGADGLEKILPDDLWPLPKYREMLFNR
jgi:glutamine synthetase